VTTGKPLPGKFLRLIGLRGPIFHWVYEYSRPPQSVDDVRTVILEILVRGGNEGFDSCKSAL
jgi:hypothetical protein